MATEWAVVDTLLGQGLSAYGEGNFLTFDSSGTAPAISSNGVDWTAASPFPTGSWRGGAYGMGLFIIVGDGGVSATSADGGATWTAGSGLPNEDYDSVSASDGLFVAVGSDGSADARVQQSTDGGVSWVTSGIAIDVFSVAEYVNGRHVIISDNSIYNSIDGSSWTAAATVAAPVARGIAHGNGTYVLLLASGATLRSTDLITWTAGTNLGAGAWTGITYQAGEFIAVASSAVEETQSSADGITWAPFDTGLGHNGYTSMIGAGEHVFLFVVLTSIIVSNGEFVPPGTPELIPPTQPLPVEPLHPSIVDCLDHEAQAVSRLLVQFKESSKLQGYIKALMSEANFLECELVAVLAERGIDTSSGTQLDVIGEIVGQPRGVVDAGLLTFFGYAGAPTGVAGYDGDARYLGGNESPIGIRLLTDGEYRLFIRARIAKNQSKGNINSLVDMVTFLINSTAFVLFDGPGPAEFTLGFDIGTLSANDKVFLTDSDLIPKPAGVAINLFEYPTAGAFGYVGAAGVIAGYDVGQYIGSF